MKKFISVLLVFVMLLMSVSAFAIEAEKPARVPYDTGERKVELPTNAKRTVANVDADDGGHSNYGTVDVMTDGKGMVGVDLKNQDGLSKLEGGNKARWAASTKSATPTFTITFPSAVSVDTIKWTEGYRCIGEYEFEFYNGDTKLSYTKSGEFTDTAQTGDMCFYLRTVPLDQAVTVDKIVFKVKTCLRTDVYLQIAEIEFWRTTEVSVNVDKYSGFGEASSIIDGSGMIDGETITEGTAVSNSLVANNKRWMAGAYSVTPTFTIALASTVTIDEIRWTECRRCIGEYEFEFYNGETKLDYTKSGAFTTDSTGNDNLFYLRTVPLEQTVTADKIVFKVKTNLRTDKYMSIAEIELWTSTKAPTITDADGTAVAPQTDYTPVSNMFDGNYTINGSEGGKFGFVAFDSANNNAAVYKTPITISFDLGSEKTFNYAELVELRCVLGEIDVLVSSDGNSYEKVATMPKMDYHGNTGVEGVHSVSFNPVTARYVKYVIKEMATYEEIKNQGNQRAVTINEISVYNFPEIDKEAVVYPVYARGTAYDINNHSYVNANSNISINNTSNAPKEYILIGAAYNADGTLSDVYKNNVTVEANTTRTFTQYVPAKNINSIKIFVWDKNIAPIIECSSLSKTAVE